MNSLSKYSVTTLRYIHDTTTGEFLNVGLVMYSPKDKYVRARFVDKYKRIRETFPGANTRNLKALFSLIEKEFETLNIRLRSQFEFQELGDVLGIANSVFPKDDSSLQWSNVTAGRCQDVNKEFERLFDRYVSKYEIENPSHRKDQDIWQDFDRKLVSRNLSHHFESKKIAVSDDELTFNHAWKNGRWHCVQPLSFDYSSSERIREKAHKWLGQITSISSSMDEFKLYFLLGKPSEVSLIEEYEHARSILSKIPTEKEIFDEENEDKLIEVIETQITNSATNQQH